MPENRTAFRWAVTALYLYGAVFVLLSVDLLVRVWGLRAAFPRFADVAAIFCFEITRSTVTAGALALGLWLAWRRAHDPAMRALAVGIGFAAVAFTQAAAFRSFPGGLQERLARWLLAHDVPAALLRFLFGSPAWALWFALAALLLFAARFPGPVSAESIARSGTRDRPGMMAGTGIAGLDIGSLFRDLTQRLVSAGAFRPLPLALTAAALAALHHPVRESTPALLLVLLGAAVALGVVITLLRAGNTDADDVARDRLAALRAGAIAAAALFLVSGLVGLLPGAAAFLSAALLSIAPAPALYGVARAALTSA